MCNLFKKKPHPDLIDLKEYAEQLRQDRKGGYPSLPPPPPPSRYDGPDWTDEEMELMRINRKQAKEIYKNHASNRN